MRRASIVLFSILAVLCVMSLYFSYTNPSLSFPIRSFLSPVYQRFYNFFDISNRVIHPLREYAELRESYMNLLNDYAELLTERTRFIGFEEENKRIREQLDLVSDFTAPYAIARVISMNPDQNKRGLMIDKGLRDGLKEQNAVISLQGEQVSLVGIVESVSETTASVRLLTHPRSYVAARLLKTRQAGLINGNAETLFLRYLPLNITEQVAFGDLVVSSGLSSVVPPDIPIGTVTHIARDAQDLFLELQIEPLVSLESLEYLCIILSGEGSS